MTGGYSMLYDQCEEQGEILSVAIGGREQEDGKDQAGG